MSSCGEGKLSLGSYMRLSNHMGKRSLTKVVSSCGEGKLSLGSYEVMYNHMGKRSHTKVVIS